MKLEEYDLQEVFDGLYVNCDPTCDSEAEARRLAEKARECAKAAAKAERVRLVELECVREAADKVYLAHLTKMFFGESAAVKVERAHLAEVTCVKAKAAVM